MNKHIGWVAVALTLGALAACNSILGIDHHHQQTSAGGAAGQSRGGHGGQVASAGHGGSLAVGVGGGGHGPASSGGAAAAGGSSPGAGGTASGGSGAGGLGRGGAATGGVAAGGSATGAGGAATGGSATGAGGAAMGGVGGGPECSSGDTSCKLDAIRTCDSNGVWGKPVPCPDSKPQCSGKVCVAPPSCGGTAAAINQMCRGADGQLVSCCTSPVVAGGTFFRNYDGFGYKDMSHKATVASFRLDRFEVTVGRYREFVKALTSASYRPADQSGRHKHLPGGGLTDISSNDAPEYGWRAAWNDKVSTANLTCPKDPDHRPTWTSDSVADENKPITCVSWYDAYAFCIWDEGFLPSDTEWNYAAAGGADNRKYPWSGQTVDCDRAVYSPAADPVANPDLPGVNPCTSTYFPSDVGSKPKGDGKYLQADLAGNVSELVLDADGSLPGMCSNCVRGDNIQFHLRRGGSGWNADARQLSSFSIQFPETGSDQAEGTADIGFRCARPAAP